nr:uncharacterized protein LOC111504207 [Leptinotarsa decemlineata]
MQFYESCKKMQSNNRYRPFKLSQGNFRQSLSGSETDVSTSNENLSNEEKYVIRHTPRQEPQGQENLNDSKRSSLRDSLPSNRSSLDVSSSSYNTLIIHSAGDEPWTGVQEITEIPDDYLSQSSVLKHLAKEVKVPSPNSTAKDKNIENLFSFDPVSFDINNFPPPPEYPNWSDKSPLLQAVDNKNKINAEKLTLSKSQPDLSNVDSIKCDASFFRRGVSAPRPPTRGREENESKGEEIWPSAEMVEILIKENSALKQELENCYQRVERTQKLEQEILKVHKGHEDLVQSCDRRERLERAARARLQSDCARYQELNKALREQVDLLSTQMLSRSPVPDYSVPENLRRELGKREGLIKQLISQSKLQFIRDAKIAALEKTSQETEKIIAEARNEKIRHMDEVHAAQKKVADLESRLKDLESKLAERDAMIRVLQKHTYDKDVSSMLGRSPHHTPHPSLGGTDIDHVLGSTVSREELVSSVLTNSTAFGSGNSYTGSDSSYHVPSYSKYESNKTYDSTKQKLDNQLKEIDSQLDSQLLSKRGLCCFPGFANPVTAQRKGKIPKPLLAGVTSNTGTLFESGTFLIPPSRHESGDMLLLEKQGRTSQQQRMQENNDNNHSQPVSSSPANHCPAPSSLPRPPRSSIRSGLPRRMGDYNRLPDNEKKSDGGESLSSNSSSRRASPARSLIPPPRKLGEYGRLSESGGSSASLRKPSARARSGSAGERDSGSTLSDNSANSLPPHSKVRLYGSNSLRRGSSLGRDSKSLNDSSNKYRIQF